MTIEDSTTLEHSTAPASLGDAAANWVTLGTCPDMAHMNNYPVAMQRDGVLYVISGGDGGDTVLTSNDNGVTWNAPQTGDWPARRALSACLHDGRFYIVGGFSPGRGFGDTLVSDDCLGFTQLGATPAPWGVRWAHTLLSYGGKLLMIAGVAGPAYSDQVWSMDADGSWTKIAEGQFTRRAWAAGAVLGSKLLVIGGWNEPDGAFAETLVSDDGGVTWTVNKAPFTPRHSAAAVTIGDTVYLVGGCTGRPGTTFYNDTWATKDGVLWTKVDHTFGPIGRTFATANLGGKVGVVGSSSNVIGLTPPPLGWSGFGTMGHDAYNAPVVGQLGDQTVVVTRGWNYPETGGVMTTSSGAQWADVTNNLPSRNFPAGTTHNGALWFCGGEDFGSLGFPQDVYTSQDGASWTLVTATAEWSGRARHAMASFDGKLWVIAGGQNSGYPTLSDVWCSDEGPDQGRHWRLAAQPFSFRMQVTTAVFAGRLWCLGGSRAGIPLKEAWAYDPAANTWTQYTPDWPGRFNCQAQAVGDTLYVIGGRSTGILTDVWATRDGRSWTLLDSQAPACGNAGSTLRGDAIVVAGGNGPAGQSKAYRYFPPQLNPA